MMSHKKIHRFLVEHITPTAVGAAIYLNEDAIVKQVNRVLKILPGEQIQCFTDGGPEYTVTLTESTNSTLKGTVEAIREIPVPARTVIAAISIVKGDAFELVVQKLTELGVHTIVPLITARTIKKDVRMNRLISISDEAVEQCGATRRVVIAEPMTLHECFAEYPFGSVVLNPVSDNSSLGALPEKVVCYVGPEGGWDEHDEAIIESFKPKHLQITDRILRTETAAIVGAYKLLWE